MTGSAVFRRGLVKQHGLLINNLRELVAIVATDSLVCSLKLEAGTHIVIECGRFPLGGGMTLRTWRDFVRVRKLAAMNIGMTFFALGGGRREIDI